MSDRTEEIRAWLDPPLRNLTLGAEQEPELSWGDRRVRLLTELGLSDPDGHPAVAAVVEWLETLSEADRTRVIGGDELLERVHVLVTQLGAEQETAGDYDESAWAEYLGTTLNLWDGTEEAWPTWRDWFVHHAADHGLEAPVEQLAAHLDAMPNPARIATFAQYGATVQAAPDSGPVVGGEPNGPGGPGGGLGGGPPGGPGGLGGGPGGVPGGGPGGPGGLGGGPGGPGGGPGGGPPGGPGGPGGGPVPVVQRVGMSDNDANPGYATADDTVTTLETGGFAGCFCIILLGPGSRRTLAHVSSWHYPANHTPWNNIVAFRALAAAAHTVHVYHWPGYWAVGDGDNGDAFVQYFRLPGNVVVHGSPQPVSVDPAHNVTP